MKKITFAAMFLLLIASVFAAYTAGHSDGMRHAIEDSEIYAVECYNPADPAASEWNGYDLRVFIDIDGETYEHGVYQG